MNKEYKKLLFDLDNTLVDDDENRKYAIRQILMERNDDASAEKIERFISLDDKYWKDRSERKIKDPYEFKSLEEKTRWVRAQRFIMFFKDISFEEAVSINQRYIDYLSKHIVPIQNSPEILKYLYDKHYEIYIITNSPKKVITNKLSMINVEQYVKDAFSSEEAGFMKPHDGFFEKFFKKIGPTQKDDMLIIGDELEKDILGGIINGIDSCWVNLKNMENDTEYNPTYEIHNLIELKNIL